MTATASKTETKTMTMVAAINDALDLALAADDTVHIFGEDVGVMGGVFRATDGLGPGTAWTACSIRRWPRLRLWAWASAWGWQG